MNRHYSARPGRIEYLRLLTSAIFILAVVSYTWLQHGYLSLSLVAAAAFGAYMALNIGANDVANNVGPAVGARAMRLGTAVVIAAIFEAAGAIIAGGAVVSTIGSGIIQPEMLPDAEVFIWLMMAALLGAALWLNIATAIGAPVSTTHSIVGGVLGAGIAAAGWEIANWSTVGRIVASWVISPLLGGIFAAIFLFIIKHSITYRRDMVTASRRTVPVLISLMGWAFTTYLLIKGLETIFPVAFPQAAGIGLIAGAACFLLSRIRLKRTCTCMANDKESVNSLFALPLVFAAALLSFAHGSNDVANAIGPLAAIYDSLLTNSISSGVEIPFWILGLGALGLAFGLALYGPKLIKTVGTEITDMDNMRAYSIAMAAAVTVITASQLGLPVSTTHVTIGAVFGVGFLREHLKVTYKRIIAEIEAHHEHTDAHPDEVETFLNSFEAASVTEKGRMLKELKQRRKHGQTEITKKERKKLRRVYRENLVRRAIILRIAAAWIITVPGTAVLSGVIYFTIRGMLLP
ncbi:inorganic phosphate transporter [Spirochaeta africana]|uniref:Phosphate transporter n=1 Tax=Spirochaeta africana (strain ATCC 700263 / DSM 8902 / Z-7692) TaxID=889378 RepID=H9UGA7_SPIAZ|nr:inorganic phosphate transporter [Spirochaeta africana]AFG36550.1 phosphate/sulfate permease [Spirochaeta africana DSM 8902]